jgi:hypothetical protein
MADISNKTLGVFLLAAMVVSLGGFIVAFNHLDTVTGRATTDTGTTNFSINSTLSVSFTNNKVDFGTGVVNPTGNGSCTLNTTGPGMLNGGTNGVGTTNPDCIGFNNSLQPLRIQNQGTQNVTLNMTFSQTASTFIGGTTPSFTYRTSWNETSTSCKTGLNGNVSVTEVAAANTNVSICNATQFNWISGTRTLNVDLGIKIPVDATPGTRAVTITAYASSP